MNICAVRTMEVAEMEHDNSLWVNAEKLPHEPKSGHRFAVKLIVSPGLERGYVGNYAECKWCNCIFAVSASPSLTDNAASGEKESQ